MKNTGAGRGFTLIELMIVIAILAVLALIALPRFTGLIRKSKEAGTKGRLGSVRSAITLYYMENDQVFPVDYAGLIQPTHRYINDETLLFTGPHPEAINVQDIPDVDGFSDVGEWAYVSGGFHIGYFYIQCIHTDSSSKIWSSY
jgi:prepilin-type N-terminal cleavage/methylation domain-containing protein